MQDAFLAMWERWGPIVSDIEDPTAYLYRSAMNGFRHRHRRALVAARKAFGRIREDDTLERVEGQELVIRALAPLSPNQRAAIVPVRSASRKCRVASASASSPFNWAMTDSISPSAA